MHYNSRLADWSIHPLVANLIYHPKDHSFPFAQDFEKQNITSSDNAVLSDPNTIKKGQEVSLDGNQLVIIRSIHYTDARVMTNPSKLVPWSWEANSMNPATCKY